MCDDIADDWFGIDPDPVDAQPSAEDIAARLRKQQELATRQSILDAAIDSDRRRGRNATIVKGANMGFAANIAGQSPVALGTPALRTMLGK